jgi:hypothetical protein
MKSSAVVRKHGIAADTETPIERTATMRIQLPALSNDFLESNHRDEAQITAETQGERKTSLRKTSLRKTSLAPASEYFYRLSSGAIAISYLGTRALAQQLGNITVDNPTVIETSHVIHALVAATNYHNRTRFVGAASQVKHLPDETEDTFALAKAIGKASRNALLKVIPESTIRYHLNQWVEEAHRQSCFDALHAYKCCCDSFGKVKVQGYFRKWYPELTPGDLTRSDYLELWTRLLAG